MERDDPAYRGQSEYTPVFFRRGGSRDGRLICDLHGDEPAPEDDIDSLTGFFANKVTW